MKSKVQSPGSKDDGLAFISLGSNLGHSAVTIAHAMEQLQELSDQPVLKSSLWKTTPVDCPPGSPDFVNAVVGLFPHKGETPESFLKKLQALEKETGRRPKKIQNEPRVLDLDLIAFGRETRSSEELVLPHPRAHLRKFVLLPLSEIAPDLVLPNQKRTVSELLMDLGSGEALTRFG